MTTTLDTRPAPWSFAAPWGAQGFLSDIGGPVHWIEFGPPATRTGGSGEGGARDSGAPPIVFVHGLGGSHLNWALIGPQLAQGRRAYALDLRGFGLTPGARSDCTVQANAALLDRFVREIAGAPAVLIGNSMGGMVSILQAAAHPETVAGAVLVDPALPAPAQRPDAGTLAPFLLYAMPRVGELYMRRMAARMTSRQLTQRVLELCFADPSRMDPQMVEAGVALAEHRRGMANVEASFLGAARSLLWMLARRRAYRARMTSLRMPVLLINGEADRLVPIAAARTAGRLNPSWRTLFLPGVGHTPQLETPEPVITAVTEWLASTPALAAKQ